MSEIATHTLHWVQGNTVNLAIPLQKETKTQQGVVVEDYYPDLQDVVSVFACGKYLSTQLECTVNGNVVIANDNGNLKVGVYGIEIRIDKADGTKLRSMWNYQVEIHKTNDGVLTEWDDFVAPNSQTLDAAIFFFAKGDKGDKGDAGDGIAKGGTTGQLLQKKSDADYDTEWVNPPIAGVSSVNGKVGDVVLDAEDVGALPSDTPIPDAQIQSDWNQSDDTQRDFIKNKPSIPSKLSDLDDDSTHRVVTDTEKTTWNNKSDFSGSYNDLTNKPTIPTVPTNVSAFNNDAGYITKTVNDLVNYYLKSDTYTKTEVQQLISAIQQFSYQVVSSLPTASADTMNIIYLAPSADPQTQNVKDEYITIDNGVGATTRYIWEQIGSTAIDLSGYYTSQQTDAAITAALNTALADYTTTAALTLLLATKQDVINDLATIRSGASAGATAYQKPQGGIPSTDMSSAVQTSLGKADTALQSQVQSNWNETDTDDASYIKNKPTIPAAQVNSDWNAVSGVAQILNKPTIPTVPANIARYSNDSGVGIVPTDGIRAESVNSGATISVNPDVITGVNGAVGTSAITLVVPSDNLAHVWDIMMTTDSSVSITLAMGNSATILTPSGFAVGASKNVEISVIGVGTKYYLRYGEFA